MTIQYLKNEKLIVKFCIGVGNDLGRVRNKKTTWGRLKSLLCDPLVDTSSTVASYMVLDQDTMLVKKRAPGNRLAMHFEDGGRKLDKQMFRPMPIFDLDYITVEQLAYGPRHHKSWPGPFENVWNGKIVDFFVLTSTIRS